MTAVTLANAQKNLAQIIANVNDSCVPVIIASDDGKNAVLISEEDWNSLQETLYLYSKEPLSEYTPYDPNEDW